MATEAGYYRHPTLHDDTVVFVCEDDLWSVSASGGTARRLTASPGRITFPHLSPDGKTVAFTGQDDGPNEVYVMDADGGEPRRLTWLGSMTQTIGWRQDGKTVLLASDWRQFQMGYAHLYAVPLAGGPPRALPYGPARAGSCEQGGKGVVIGRNSGDPARWKRYRGGTAGTLWVDRQGKGEFKHLIRLDGNLASPMWIGSRIFFLSDHEGHGNLYSCTPTGRGLKRHTNHEDFYVRFPSTDGKRIVFHAGADLFLYDPATDEERRIPVSIRSPRADRQRKFVPSTNNFEDFDLHPQGHSLAVTARGGAFTFGLWDGGALRHGAASKERHRLAAWLPDGKHVVTVADKGGEERIVIHPADGRGRAREVKNNLGRTLELAVAPAGTLRVALTNHRQELLLVDLKGRTVETVDRSKADRIDGMAWSPDGRYLAYSFATSEVTSHIKVLDTTSGKVREITRPEFRDVRPAFDPEGKYLYFISARVFDPVYDGLYFDLGFPRGSKPYLVPLRRDLVSPFASATREPRGPEGAKPAGGDDGKPDEKKKPPKVTIHFDGIEDRIVPFPVPEGRYFEIAGTGSRALFTSLPVTGSLHDSWVEQGAPVAKAKLEAWDFEKDKVELVYGGITGFALSMDGSTLGVRVGNRIRALPASVKSEGLPKEPAGRASGWIDTGRMRVEVVPPDEWCQMFREAWRLQRDQFWTPDMSGVDWQAVYDRYLPLVDRVGSRSEFSDLMWEMQGELGTSHCYEMGGDYRPRPAWHQGFLGADLVYRPKTRTWHVGRIPKGDGWDPYHASPLAAPGLGVKEGDQIVSVAGESVGAKRSPEECLVHRANQPVPLTLRRKGGGSRTITVEAVGNEYALRYRDWVETNRAHVHRATKGRVGYVHIPDMGARGFAEFHRYYLTEVEHDGLLVDVRFNGGGHVSQLILQKLLRKRIGYGKPRWGEPYSYPMHAPVGPMVGLTNEYAGSDGDMFSHGFKAYGLGPLIGVRTWGGVVGIWPRHALVDGTVTTQPEFSAWYFDGGFGVENYGVDPDIEVEIKPQDHAAGRDPQLERALTEIQKILSRTKIPQPEFADRPDLSPPSLPEA